MWIWVKLIKDIKKGSLIEKINILIKIENIGSMIKVEEIRVLDIMKKIIEIIEIMIQGQRMIIMKKDKKKIFIKERGNIKDMIGIIKGIRKMII